MSQKSTASAAATASRRQAQAPAISMPGGSVAGGSTATGGTAEGGAASAGSAVRVASSATPPSVAAPWGCWERRENFMSRVSGRGAINRL